MCIRQTVFSAIDALFWLNAGQSFPVGHRSLGSALGLFTFQSCQLRRRPASYATTAVFSYRSLH